MTKDSKIVINKEISDPEYYAEKEVKKYNKTSSVIYLPEKHKGKKAIVIIEKEEK